MTGQWRSRRGRQRLLHGLTNFRFGQSRRQAVPHRLAHLLTGTVLNAGPAHHIGAGDDRHAAARLPFEHPLRFQLGIGTLDDLRIGEQLLGERAKIRQCRLGR